VGTLALSSAAPGARGAAGAAAGSGPVAPDWVATTPVPAADIPASGLAAGVVADADGTVWFTSWEGTLVRRAPDGALTAFGDDAAYQFFNGVARGPGAAVYVAHEGAAEVLTWRGSAVTATPIPAQPVGLAVVGSTLFASAGTAVYRAPLAPDGTIGSWAVHTSGLPGLVGMLSVAPDGSLVLAEYAEHRIVRVSATTGAVTPLAGAGVAGHDDGPADAATFTNPRGALEVGGVVYIGDGDRIRVLDLATATVSTLAGPAPAGRDGCVADMGLREVWGFAPSASGGLWVADWLGGLRHLGAPTLAPPPPTVAAAGGTGSIAVSLGPGPGGCPVLRHDVIFTHPEEPPVVQSGLSGERTSASGLVSGTWTVTARAVNSTGVGPPATTTAVVAGAPSRPRTVVADVTPAGGRVAVRWAPPSSDGGAPVTGYVVVLAPPTGSPLVATPTGTAVTFRGVPAGPGQRVTVQAVNTFGTGPGQSGDVRLDVVPWFRGLPVVASGEAVNPSVPTVPITLDLAGRAPAAVAATPDGAAWFAASPEGDVIDGATSLVVAEVGAGLNAPVTGLAVVDGGAGYVAAATDGGVFALGTAGFHGSLGAVRLNAPVVGVAATPSGGGYWLVAADGGVFAFGDAGFRGSLGGVRLHAPVVGVAATPSGGGYWLVAADGGVFAFGDAGFHGSLGGTGARVAGLVPGATAGYWLVGTDGSVTAFANAG
jgi:hypothetical protein